MKTLEPSRKSIKAELEAACDQLTEQARETQAEMRLRDAAPAMLAALEAIAAKFPLQSRFATNPHLRTVTLTTAEVDAARAAIAATR